MKKMWKRFWTLSKRQSGGFTLVELIVVIAILAVLAGVGVPVYSGYVKKANIAADEQLFAEIERAVHLAYYSDTDEFEGGYISLSPTADAKASSADLESAMTAAFGDNWKATTRVLCTDWTSAAYVNSSFHGQETALLGVVEELTETLEALIEGNNSLVGANFSEFLTDLNVNAENDGAVADAAVLYVARDSSEMSETQRQAVINAMAGMLETNDPIGNINAAMGGNKVVAACAAYYAIVEGYCRYANSKGYTDALAALNGAGFGSNPQDAGTAVSEKINAVMAVVLDEQGNFKADSYVVEYFADGGQAAKDAEAYLDVLNTVHSAQSDILNIEGKELGDANFYDEENGELEKLFVQVANGGALVFAKVANGELFVSLPGRD